jgi:hypothetical protein
MKARLWLLLVIISACSCTGSHHTVSRGFYWWKTVYKPSAYERSVLGNLEVHNMYLRLFDVDWDSSHNEAVAVAPVKLDEWDTTIVITPVIFITQRTLNRVDSNSVDTLAGKISGFAAGICGSACRAREVQVDCDWTAGTKDVYFKLLTALRKQPFFKGKYLSCTIRMHQVKYTLKNGIPPVDKGLLMCYNMGDMKKMKAPNSILNMADANSYLGNLGNYPLPLDVALPLFRWCLLFRKEQFVGILRDLTPEMLKHNALFTHERGSRYSCIIDTTWQGYNLKTGDVIRVEDPSYKDLEKLARLTSDRITNKDISVLFFSCDSATLSKYTTHDLEALYNIYN